MRPRTPHRCAIKRERRSNLATMRKRACPGPDPGSARNAERRPCGVTLTRQAWLADLSHFAGEVYGRRKATSSRLSSQPAEDFRV